MARKVTLSVIKADVGGFVGHSSIHEDLLTRAREVLAAAPAGLLVDHCVSRVGDDMALIMTHHQGVDSERIHELAWNTLESATEVARELHLYGAGQDLLVDAFSGNVKGMGPGAAELEFEERPSEPLVVFLADKTAPGAWNLPLVKMFADPFSTPGLVIDTKMHRGFVFTVLDAMEGKVLNLTTPEDYYDLLMFLGAPNRFVVKSIRPRDSDEACAAASTTKLALIAGRYVGKDDPCLIVRCQSGLPAVGEVTEPFSFPWIVTGWMRGSHTGPLMPVSVAQANPSRFDGPPRVVGLGFQLADGRLIGPRDMFDDPAFDKARNMANDIADILRRHGPFEPHRLPLEELEYTTMAALQEKLADRWTPEPDGVKSHTTAKVAATVGQQGGMEID
ncbi:MAG: fructose-1,6-bisphosphate aldolase/phosphatase [Candidatus Dormibacteria bacterium]